MESTKYEIPVFVVSTNNAYWISIENLLKSQFIRNNLMHKPLLDITDLKVSIV